LKWWQELTDAELEDQIEELQYELDCRRPRKPKDALMGSILLAASDLLKNNTNDRFESLLDCKLSQLREDLVWRYEMWRDKGIES
jgi:hypothetical protein